MKRRERQRDGLLESAGEREKKGSLHGEECMREGFWRGWLCNEQTLGRVWDLDTVTRSSRPDT